MTTQDPDPRTTPESEEDATNQGRSTQEPAEGDDASAPRTDGSPQG